DDQQFLQGYLVEVHDLADTLPAQVHERLRLDEQDLLVPLSQLRHLGPETALKTAGLWALGQGVDHVEADVMPRPGVAAAGVAQADDDFHGLRDYSPSSSSVFCRPM